MSGFDHYDLCPRCTDSGRDRARDNLAVYKDGSSHCFSCGLHRFPRGWRPVQVKEEHAKGLLPADFSREVPARAWEWLLQYGLGWKYWQPFVGWSEKDQRLVFQCGTPVRFSMGRFIGTGQPEANTGASSGKPRKWFVYGDSHRIPILIEPSVGTSDGNGGDVQPKKDGPREDGRRVVLVEDIVSAHKVGQITKCIPLFGTRVSDPLIPTLRHLGMPVLMWLDKDQEIAAARRAAHLAMVSGLSVKYVFTDSDPKCLSISKITEIVNEHI